MAAPTRVELLDRLFDALCRSEAEFQQKAAVPTVASGGSPLAHLQKVNRLAVVEMRFKTPQDEARFYRELQQARERFAAIVWAHVKVQPYTRAQLQAALAGLDLHPGSFADLLKGTANPCGLSQDLQYQLLNELKPPAP